MSRTNGGAGASAMRRFREERRETMRADRRSLIVTACLTIGFAAWMIVGDGSSQVAAAFVCGGLATALWFGWMLGFDARSLRWRWGALGEQWTAEKLDRLGPAWTAVHDVPDGRGNIDHVLVGPAGVFTIDSKNLSEPARVDERGLRAGRLVCSVGAARGAAVRLKEEIERHAGVAPWVQAMIVVWGDFDEGVVERDRVIYVRGPKLVDALTARPHRLSDDTRARVVTALEQLTARTS